MNFSLSFRIDKTGNGILAPSRIFKSILIFIAIVFTAVSILDITQGLNPYLAVILVFASLCGALYREDWVFDKNKEKVFFYTGIGPFVKKRVIPFNVIKSVALVSIHHTKAKVYSLTSSLKIKDEYSSEITVPNLEAVKGRHARFIQGKVEKIAAFMHKEVEFIDI